MRILVTGGAGYIGTHTIVELLQANHEVLVLDNLSNGHLDALNRVKLITNREVEFVEADIRDVGKLGEVFGSFKPEGVVHFAGLKAVGECVSTPLIYYDNNVTGSVNLLAELRPVFRTVCLLTLRGHFPSHIFESLFWRFVADA